MPNNRTEQIQLTPQQKQNFSANLKMGVLKELKKMPVTTEVLCDISQTLMAGATKKKYGSIRQSIFLMHPKIFSGRAG